MKRLLEWRYVLLCVLLNCSVSTPANDSPPDETLSDGCSVPDSRAAAARVDVRYETQILADEYIVEFKRFYRQSTRLEYLRAAATRANTSSWTLLPRHNAAALYPSDFEVVKFADASPEAVATLALHPAIKRISPHRSVQRVLNFVPVAAGNWTEDDEDGQRVGGRSLLRIIPKQITADLQANFLWELGITGRGVKIAVFDTGLAKDHPHFRSVKERTNWTNEKSLDDGVSHGTFVAGVIASSRDCLGFAPDAELHIYRVFTNTQVSYTSWFLDAFNYAIFRKINILNLSIGGPDFLDRPFVDKVLELSANKVIMVSAIGNDGPLYGTLNNPGDQSDVIGVGGINFNNKVAKFSSRGMTTWELPYGYGRLKPDIVTYGNQVQGSNVRFGCRTLSGTSVASPVVSGAITLIISGGLNKLPLINPASMKQILIEGADRLQDNNMFEQGHGMLNILKSMQLLLTYVPKVTLSPAYLDVTEAYMWPYSSQPLFCDSKPIIVNVTVLNGISVTGRIVDRPQWYAYTDKGGDVLDVAITYSPTLWPWSGWMAVHISVKNTSCDFDGIGRGHIKLLVQNPSTVDAMKETESSVLFPITIRIIPKPPRHKRLLWDQYHSLRYPPGYIPRDNLKIKSDPLDWRADHMHTNFIDLYGHLRNAGYYVDILRTPFTCFNASDYGTLLIVDPEEEFFDEEIAKIETDIYDHGLGVIVFADWYNTTVMKKIRFFDENTRQWWIPDTGGCNIPAVNDLLKPFGVALSDLVATGAFRLGDHVMHFASGSTIAKFPNYPDNIIIGAELFDQGAEIIDNVKTKKNVKNFLPILGLLQTKHTYRHTYKAYNSSRATQSAYEDYTPDHLDLAKDGDGTTLEKNPILNKRILLNAVRNNRHHKEPSKGSAKRAAAAVALASEPKLTIGRSEAVASIGHKPQPGRLVIFGDSNCLDSTHLEKPCFWLLDALLDYTMNGHKSVLLQNLNRLSEFDFVHETALPLRLVNSNLHLYSKVLDSSKKLKKKPLPPCDRAQAEPAIMMNSSDILQIANSIQVNKDILITYFKNKLAGDEADDKLLEAMNDGKDLQVKSSLGLGEEEPISSSLFFLIALTLCVVLIFLNWFLRKRHFK